MHGMVPEFFYRFRHKIFVPIFAYYLELLLCEIVGAYLLEVFNIFEQLVSIDKITVDISEIVYQNVAPVLKSVEVDKPLSCSYIGFRKMSF
jgi:hypothetical protein